MQDEPSEEYFLIALSRSPRWHDQAVAFRKINDERLFRKWTNPSDSMRRPYHSLRDFAQAMGISVSHIYKRIQLSEDPRFPLLKGVPVDMSFALRLYDIPLDDPLFEILIILLRLGCFQDEVQTVLDSTNPMDAALQLKRAKLQQTAEDLARLHALLPERTKT
jgi:hypothetical protein